MILGNKSIKSTETYIHLEQMIYQGKANDQFSVKVADTLEDAIKLMEVGFELHVIGSSATSVLGIRMACLKGTLLQNTLYTYLLFFLT